MYDFVTIHERERERDVDLSAIYILCKYEFKTRKGSSVAARYIGYAGTNREISSRLIFRAYTG